MIVRASGLLFVCMLLSYAAPVLAAGEIPTNHNQVAAPGGQLPGSVVITLEKIAEGFDDPVNVTNAGDDTGRIFVVERIGRVKIITADGDVLPTPFLDLTAFKPSVINPSGNDVQSGFIEQGLFSIAFHPEFAKNGFFYVHYTSLLANGAGIVVRFQVDQNSPNVVTAERARQTETVLMRIDQPSVNNNGGQIAFGPDGYLYIGLGDGGWGAPANASQELSTRLGKILRIDVDSAEPYAAPDTNPFADSGGSPQDEIWITGLHNPYKFNFDNRTGDLFIADVGDSHWEEINFVPANSGGGANFGWPKMEGTQCHPIIANSNSTDCERFGALPAAQYPHPDKNVEPDDSGAFPCASVQGLGVANNGAMQGVYLFGDWCSGNVYGLGWDGKQWQMETLLETDLHITAGGLDESGQVMLLSAKFYFDDQNPSRPPYGTVWRISSAKP